MVNFKAAVAKNGWRCKQSFIDSKFVFLAGKSFYESFDS